MCGRYATTRGAVDLSELFEAWDGTGEAAPGPDYNVAPTDPVPIVRAGATGREVAVARWGLVPHWAKDTRSAARMINARAETVATSSAFASSFASRRCLIPADGWYEWRRGPDGRKQAFFMTSADGAVLAFAGIWTRREDLVTCAIVTTAATGALARVHDRMPLLLPTARWARWLGVGSADGGGESGRVSVDSRAEPGPGAARRASEPVEAGTLLATPPDDFLATLEIRPVGPAVGDVRNDGPGLIARVEAVGAESQPLF